MILLFGVAVGVMVGALLGGSLAGIERSSLRGTAFYVFGIAAQLLSDRIGWPIGALIFPLGLVGVTIGAILDFSHSGMFLIAAGTSLNLLIVSLNHGQMPVAVSEQRFALAQGFGTNLHIPMSRRVRLPFLGDVIRLPLFGHEYLLSPGDVLLMVGVAVVIVQMMTSVKRSCP